MFTGIIQYQSRINKILKRKGEFTVSIQKLRGLHAKKGASIAVNGICSTIAKISPASIMFEYMRETLRKTNIEQWRAGELVNLETSLTLSSLLDGHLVMGHVDTVGHITNIMSEDNTRTLTITIPKSFSLYVVPKGSITIEGISLTVVGKMTQSFTVSLIPYTLAHTNLEAKKVGDTMNLEFDILAKYLHEILHHANKRRK